MTKDFPLEGECNAAIPQGPHPIACEAAAAVRLARENGKAEALEDWLFANQPTLTPGRAEAGGPGHRRRAPTSTPSIRRSSRDVKTDTSLGGFLGVRSTPTFFVNGIQMPDSRGPDHRRRHRARAAKGRRPEVKS